MKTIISILSFLIFSSALLAQNMHFPGEGVIEYEKKVNVFAVFKRAINKENESYLQQAYDQYKKSQPQFKVLKSSLSFSSDKSLYTPVKGEMMTGFLNWFPEISQPNIIFNDFATGRSTTQKSVFEQTFLMQDSIRNIKWKITDETREIAGYPCRRANALVMDSIYVVAFYTDKIPVSGGPESFSGLPGMILGVALPHENITWFATSVAEKPVNASIKAPVKGKVTDSKGLLSTLKSALKEYGDYAKIAIKAYLL